MSYKIKALSVKITPEAENVANWVGKVKNAIARLVPQEETVSTTKPMKVATAPIVPQTEEI